MERPCRLVLSACLFITLASPARADDDPTSAAWFAAHIEPVLKDACLRCHSGDKTRGGLRLDTRADLLRGGERGPAIVPGNPAKSLLIQAIRHVDKDMKMPPGKPLPAEVVRRFESWIQAGAVWPKDRVSIAIAGPRHWAFAPIGRPQPPAIEGVAPIDRFILARLRDKGLSLAPEGSRTALIRRVTFDLIGLPPTPEEIDAFVADRRPDAYERLIERLLASPHHGERWARHWLDVVRYADSAGFEADHLYPSAWRYRDYVIRAFNNDRPIDRFIQEQIAGDELWPDDPEAARATALYCFGPTLEESAMIGQQLEHEWLVDAVDTTGAAFLGLTLGCARCHNHKFDPLLQTDYYALQAIFAASDRPYPGKIRLQRIKALNGLLSDAPVPRDRLDDPRCTIRTEDSTGFRLFARKEAMVVHRLHRGELEKPREVMQPALPQSLRTSGSSDDFSKGQRRAVLARWLTAEQNPLTARVFVNRVWAWHFGVPLVRTPNDFGTQGEAPSHPELLDWLARDFIEHGWKLKRLHRMILLSAAYRQSSVSAERGTRNAERPAEADPENRLLRHFPRRRLEGEAVRDAMLACAGTLNRRTCGPPVVPRLDGQELTGLFDAGSKWPITRDAREHTRRSIYLLQRRTFVHPILAAFDAPDAMASCQARQTTIVPTQALALLNSPLARTQCAAFARRLLAEAGPDCDALAARAWLLAFGRPIRDGERAQAVTFLKRRNAEPLETALADLCLALFNANEFIYLD